jgi:hypothetical protein
MRHLYQAEFIGGIKIENLDPVGYKVSFYLDNPEYPLVIIADLPDEEFLPFIKEELRSRKLVKTKYFKTIKLPPEQPKICG